MSARAIGRAVGALALAVACAAGAVPAVRAGTGAPAPPLRLTIVFTGDVSGYLEPCG